MSKSLDTNNDLVETNTISYSLEDTNVLSFYPATAQNNSGTLSMMPQ